MNKHFDSKLDQMSEKYLHQPATSDDAGCKTTNIIEQGMSLFDQGPKKKTFAQKAGEVARKAITKPAALAQSIQDFEQAQKSSGTMGALARSRWAQSKSDDDTKSPPEQQATFMQQDPVTQQATLKQQWKQLSPELQQAYGREDTYIKIKQLEAKHSK